MTVISVLISFYFDTAMRKMTGMSGQRWNATMSLMQDMVKTLSKHKDTIRMSSVADLQLEMKARDDEPKDNVVNPFLSALLENEGGPSPQNKEKGKFGGTGFGVIITDRKKKALDPKYQWVYGDILSNITQLTEQFFASLKSIPSSKTQVYSKRLNKVNSLTNLYKAAIRYFGFMGNVAAQSEIQVLYLSAVHANYDESLDALKTRIEKEQAAKLKRKQMREKEEKLEEEKQSESKEEEKDSKETSNGTSTDEKRPRQRRPRGKVPKLSARFRGQKAMDLPHCDVVKRAVFVFENGRSRLQTKAMLYLIFYMAVHNRYEECRDLLLMSHLGSRRNGGEDPVIAGKGIDMQILYNRAVAMFAVCAFVVCEYRAAELILQDLFASNRIKILLAQGFTKAPLEISTNEQLKQSQVFTVCTCGCWCHVLKSR